MHFPVPRESESSIREYTVLSVGRMRKPRSALILIVLFVFGFSLAVPAEDLPETAYDESEAYPYESTPLTLELVSEAAASSAWIGVTLDHHFKAQPPQNPTRAPGKEAHLLPAGRTALSFLCTLLC